MGVDNNIEGQPGLIQLLNGVQPIPKTSSRAEGTAERLLNPVGMATNIDQGLLYDAARAIEKNPMLDFLFGGLADYAKGIATNEPPGAGKSLFAALDMPGPGTFMKGGKVSIEAL